MIRQNDAGLRFYFHIDPDQLSDEEWAERVQELIWVIDMENKKYK